MKSNYRSSIKAEYIISQHVMIRWKKTIKFLIKKNSKSGLDIGDRTPFTDQLEFFFGCKFSNTNQDLDIEKLKGTYDIITAFEVVEHLYNPLHCLLQIRNILNDNGTLYLSTPLGKPYFLWSDQHFHEMEGSRLKSLINRAGFRIVRTKKIKIQPFWFYFTGIRPFLRFIFEKHILLELQKIDL